LHRLLIVLSVFAGALCPASARVHPARQRYDIFYSSGTDLAVLRARRETLAAALGPRVARSLRVVQSDGAYQLVYLRRGTASGARATAAAHVRILRCKGLGAAEPVPARPWFEAVDSSSRTASPVPAQDADKAQATERRSLEALVDEHLKELRREGRISPDERMAWYVYDFTTGEKLVEINTGLQLQAASLIKPFVVLAFMDTVKDGKLVYDAQSRYHLERMIQHSDNSATDWAMRRLGGPAAVQALLRRHYGSLLSDVAVVEYIGRGGRTYRNKASAQDYSRFLLALWKNELPGSVEIRRLMALPKRDRLLTGARLPEGTEVFSKTGSTSRLCGDMGVLLAKGPDGRQYAYTLIGIIEKQHPARHYLRWLKARGNVIREMSGLVYRVIGQMHGFSSAQ